MNGLYVLPTIVIVDNKNNINNHEFIKTFIHFYLYSKMFLNNGVQHNIATVKVIISILLT